VADLVVGARGDDTGGTDRGAIHVLSMNTDGTVDGTVKIASGTTNGPTLGDTSQYGISVASLGDLNGDGAIDLVVGAAFDDTGSADRGAIHIHFMSSNPRGTMEPASTVKVDDSTTNGPVLADSDGYGRSVTLIGDLNGDGVGDVAVGSDLDDAGGTDRGAVHIHFMNTDGSVDGTVEINDTTTNGPVLSDTDRYGRSVASIGDLNGDGVGDIAVGAFLDDAGGTDRGAVHIHFMNTDGTIDSTVEINDTTTNGPVLSDSDGYGRSVTSIGDLNNDGVGDIAVGAYTDNTGGTDRGAVHISFMNTNGSIDSTVKIDDTTTNGPVLSDSDLYGGSIASIGDLNSDGVADIAVGAYHDDSSGTDRGAIHIHFMNTDGSIDSTVEINDATTNGPVLSDSDRYGSSVASLGDLNSDGVGDIAVGAYTDDTGGTDRGAVHISFMNTNGSIDSTVKIDDTTTNGPVLSDSDNYGYSLAAMGDLNGDGVADIAVGAYTDDAGGTDRGAIHIHFMQVASGTTDPTLNNAITASRLKAGASATYDFGFTLQNTITGTLTITFPAGFTVTGALTSGSCTGGTVETFGFTSSTLTAVKTGCTAGALTVSGATVTNHSTPGSYTITWVNDDPGEGEIYIVDDDQVTVTANVDPTLTMNAGSQASATACDGTFSGNGGTVALGALTVGAVSSSDASSLNHICTRLSTNASSGAVMTVKSLNGASGLVSTSVPTDTIPSPGGSTTISAGTAGYAICAGSAGGDSGNDAISGAASPTRSSPFNGASCTSSGHNVGGLTTSAQSLWTLSGPSQNAFVRVYVKAAISPVTPAHSDYTDTLTFIGTGTF